MPVQLEINTALIQLLNCALATLVALYGTQKNWRLASALLTYQCAMVSLIFLCCGFWPGHELLMLKAELATVGLIATCVGMVLMLAPYRFDPENFININERNGYRIIDRKSFS